MIRELFEKGVIKGVIRGITWVVNVIKYTSVLLPPSHVHFGHITLLGGEKDKNKWQQHLMIFNIR